MRIYATFANRHYDPEVVEMVHAWDEYCADGNWTGYEDTKREALAAMGSDLLRAVAIEIEVSAAKILAALNPRVCVTGDISAATPIVTPTQAHATTEPDGDADE